MYKDVPVAHDSDSMAVRFAPHSWRAKGVKLHPDNDLPQVFRTCSYCGSIHPEDLLEALRAGARLSSSDWKYGWPHKFYVDGIPNTNIGQPAGLISGSVRKDQRAEMEQRYAGRDIRFEETEYGLRYRVYEPEGATTHGKFYTLHLADVDEPAFGEIARYLEAHTGVLFAKDTKGISYKGIPQ
jgi:hypothetical protein